RPPETGGTAPGRRGFRTVIAVSRKDVERDPALRYGVDGELRVEHHRLARALRRTLGVERAQHLLGRDRQLGYPDPDRVVDGRRDRGRLRVVRHLADPLRAVWAVGGGVLDDDRVDLREVLEPRREIRAELPAAVIDGGVVRVAVLEHAEPEALHGAPLDLPLDEGGVDGEPDVVDLDEARHAHHARLVVDLHLGRAGRI